MSEPPFTEIQGAVPTDLSQIALEYALIKAKIPQSYTLHVGENLRIVAMGMLRSIQGQQANNSLCPYINLEVHAELGPNTWYLVTPDGNFGSRGY